MKFLKFIQLLSIVLFTAYSFGADKPAVKYFEFPKPTGQYAVGTQLIELTDENRLESTKGEPAKFRRLPVQVWYPAEGKLDKAESPYTYEMLKELKKMCAEDFEGGILPKELSEKFDLINLSCYQI